MSDWALLRVMVLKEARTTFRERSQLRALIVVIVLMVFSVGMPLYQVIHQARQRRQAQPVVSIPGVPGARVELPAAVDKPASGVVTAAALAGGRWVGAGGAALLGFFFSMGYLLSAVLASFVGEKEARTLEILLASPLSDRKLYTVKSVAVLVPSALLGFVCACAAAALVLILTPADLLPVPMAVVWTAPLLGLPLMVLPQLWFVGLGAAISARAETVKGAGQLLSVALLVPMFLVAYGGPLLLQLAPGVRQPVMEFVQRWLAMPFAVQYALALLGLAVPAVICLGLGRAAFRRDRMLT